MNKKQKSIIYYAVAAYILYMVYGIAKNKYMGDNTFTMPVAVGICVVMGAAAIGIVVYATRMFLRAKKEQEQEKNTDSISAKED